MKKEHINPKFINAFIEISHRLRQRGLTFGGGGGISLRIPNSNKVLIKGWEVASEDAQKKDIALVDLSGKQLNQIKPCLESPLHLAVLKARKDIKAVIHAHAPYLTAFGNLRPKLKGEVLQNYPLLKMTAFTSYADPGSRKLAELVARPFHTSDEVICVFMEDHGVTVGGADIFNAYYRLDILEGMAKTFVLTMLLKQDRRLPQ